MASLRREGCASPSCSPTIVVIAYLALRLPILLDSARNSAYAWSPRNIAPRTTEYLLYPFTPPLFEIAPLLRSASRGSPPRRLASCCCCMHSGHGWRWPIAWLAAVIAALAPVLVLPIAYDHYAYLASAAGIAIAAAAWPMLRPRPRAVLLILAAIVLAHGAAVMSRMVAAGVVERNLHADLLDVVQDDPRTPIVVRPPMRATHGFCSDSCTRSTATAACRS